MRVWPGGQGHHVVHTGWKVQGYTEGEEPLIYAVTTVESISKAGLHYVFSDGHGIASYTEWFNQLGDLDKVDWEAVYARYWRDPLEDNDLQRRKQAEFLVYQFCPWPLIQEIGVLNNKAGIKVSGIMAKYGVSTQVIVRKEWYY